MKFRPFSAFATFTMLAVGCAAVSAQTMKPGLWEITHKAQFGSEGMNDKMAAMQKQMDNMSPEQRKMMDDMMAKNGMKMGGAGGGMPGGMSIKTCMTKEMIEKNEVPAGQGDCTSTASPRIGNTQKISFTCTKPPSSGEGQMTFNGSDSYTMKLTVNTQVRGKPEKMDMEGSGKWLGADCGDVKPIRVPKK
jgi:hypothetical protein